VGQPQEPKPVRAVFPAVTRPTCMICHGTGVAEGRRAVSDLPLSAQFAIMRWTRTNSPLAAQAVINSLRATQRRNVKWAKGVGALGVEGVGLVGCALATATGNPAGVLGMFACVSAMGSTAKGLLSDDGTPTGPSTFQRFFMAQGISQRDAAALEAVSGFAGSMRAPAATPVMSGGRWRWGYGAIREGEAGAAYQAIRESTTDVAAISRYTGYRADRIQRIKDYLFNNPEWTGADSEIAAAWHRLRTGRGTEVDRLLLKHETAEMWMRKVKGADYWEAHRRANQHWNWQRTIEERSR